jgi:hypothetical protein
MYKIGRCCESSVNGHSSKEEEHTDCHTKRRKDRASRAEWTPGVKSRKASTPEDRQYDERSIAEREVSKGSFENLLNDLGRQVVNVVMKLGNGSCGVCHVLGHGEDGLQQNLSLMVECSRSFGITSQRVCNLLVIVSVSFHRHSLCKYLILLIKGLRGCEGVVVRPIYLDSDVQNVAEVLSHICLCFLGPSPMTLKI